MKSTVKIIVLFLVLNTGTWVASQKASAQSSVDFQIFYDELSPYGTWINNPDYGYVWLPNVSAGFIPYATNGHWVFTEDGWTWFSDYPWGWAPFHYGRWYTDPVYGPMWVPDNEWGPGWVVWRRSEGYYGWAPIEPGIDIHIAYGNGYRIPNNRWTFVRGRDFGRTNLNRYYLKSSNNLTIINNTTVIENNRVNRQRNSTYNAGPDRTEVEKYRGRPVPTVVIHERSRPGGHLNNNNFQLYRPMVQRNNATGPKPAPKNIAGSKDVRPFHAGANTTPQPNANQTIKPQSPGPPNTGQPVIQQPSQQQHANPIGNAGANHQPAQNQPPQNQSRPNSGLARPPQQARQPNNQPQVQPQVQPQRQPVMQSPQQPVNQPRPQPSQPQQAKPFKNGNGGNQPQPVKPNQNPGEVRPQRQTVQPNALPNQNPGAIRPQQHPVQPPHVQPQPAPIPPRQQPLPRPQLPARQLPPPQQIKPPQQVEENKRP